MTSNDIWHTSDNQKAVSLGSDGYRSNLGSCTASLKVCCRGVITFSTSRLFPRVLEDHAGQWQKEKAMEHWFVWNTAEKPTRKRKHNYDLESKQLGTLECIEIQLLRFCSFETALTESVGTAHAINLQQVKVNNEWAGKARSLHEYFFGNHVNVCQCVFTAATILPLFIYFGHQFSWSHQVPSPSGFTTEWRFGPMVVSMASCSERSWASFGRPSGRSARSETTFLVRAGRLEGWKAGRAGADPGSDPPGSPGEFGGTTCLLGFVKQEVAILTLESVRHAAKHSLKSLRIKHIFHGRMVFFCYMQIRSFARTSCRWGLNKQCQIGLLWTLKPTCSHLKLVN